MFFMSFNDNSVVFRKEKQYERRSLEQTLRNRYRTDYRGVHYASLALDWSDRKRTAHHRGRMSGENRVQACS